MPFLLKFRLLAVELKLTFFTFLQRLVLKQNVPVSLLGTRFTNAISYYEPGPQDPYREIIF
jgi:hypothetical protein